jgi:uncharacterized iron-regulated membrane protein
MFENTSDMLEFNNQKIADILLPNTILMLAGCALSIVGNITVMHIHWRKLPENTCHNNFLTFKYLEQNSHKFKVFTSLVYIYIFVVLPYGHELNITGNI